MIHHDGSALYVPDRAPVLGGTTDVYVRASANAGVDRVWARWTFDREPRFVAATDARPPAARTGERWFRVRLPLRNPVSRYRFLLDGPGGYRWLTAAGVFPHDVGDDTDFRIVCGHAPPDWAADATVYLIFPDRFARSAAAADRQLPDWAVARDWDHPVSGDGPDRPREIYGGDLDGIADRLDHIASVGADTICLTPFFPAPANHRYCPTTFDRVDPLLGGDAALRRLTDAAHRRGMRVVGDLTTNHTGDRHDWFRDALAGRHRDLYYFDDDLEFGYETWVSVRRMPKLNWTSAELRRRFLDGPDSVVRRWLEAGLDGWRIDVANTTGRRIAEDNTHDVARGILAAMTRSRPDALLLAENAHDATGDLDAAGWHGTMNYAGFTRPVWTWLATEPLPFLGVPVGVPRLPATAMVATMRAFAARMSWRSLTTSWSLLDSHDTPRFRTLAGNSAGLVEVGVGLMATLPGTPMVYYGDEVGLSGTWPEDGRRTIPWHDRTRWDHRLLAVYTDLLALRREQVALRHGGLRFLHVGTDRLAFLRETADERLLVLAARRPVSEPLRLPGIGAADNIYGGAPDLAPGDPLSGDGPTFQVWRLAD
ncbi:glycoside hydrolase family 13 protein [Polymorphospora rubra]|uniref:glycoside hydrolase family 13 protein n=1 Tax=Polymorphospora rubra TaxID=338584 RepID=UPI0033EF56F3